MRIKKALGIFRELITTTRTTVAFWDPPSLLYCKDKISKDYETGTTKHDSKQAYNSSRNATGQPDTDETSINYLFISIYIAVSVM